MKALVYNGPWDMTLTEMERPVPEPGQALIKVEAVGICGSDVHGFTGESGRRKPGMVMGHEVAGRVVEVSPNDHSIKEGDLVTPYNITSCDRCVHCLSNNPQLCAERSIIGVNAGTWGAMAEFLAFPVNGLYPLAEDVNPAAALLAEPLGIGLHAIKHMNPSPDSVLAIVGSGTIGLGLAMALQTKGIQTVFALDILQEKLDLIATMGAQPVNVADKNPLEEIQRVTGSPAVHGAFEAVGIEQTVRDAFNLVQPGGTLVLIGNLAKEIRLSLQAITDREITIKGSYGIGRDDFAEAVDLINRKVVPVDQLITGYCSLEETPGVMTQLAKGELDAVKIVIQP